MRLTILMAALSVAALPSPSLAATDDFQVWSSVEAGGSLGGSFEGSVELGARFDDDASRLGVKLGQISVSRRLNPDLALSGGYVRRVRPVDDGPDRKENRLYQQVDLRFGRVGAGTLSSRIRLEQRFLSTGDDVGLRLRARLRYSQPVTRGGTILLVSAEPIVVLNATDWGARSGLDQLRGFAGLNIPLAEHLRVETGYLHRWQARSGDHDHVLPVSLKISF